jgi:hypothetical protein
MTRKRRRALTGTLVGVGVVVALGLIVVTVPAFKFEARVRGRLQQAGVLPQPLPIYSAPNAPADRVTVRRLVVASLHDALARGDYEQAATLNAMLSQEAFQRAYRALRAWETTRDPETGLLPWALARHYQEWDVNRIGANLYAHLLIASHYVDPGHAALWEEILRYEHEICGRMPCSIESGSGNVQRADQDTLIRGASEYTRDGLLAVTERFGEGIWSDRMLEGADAILDAAYIETEMGALPANSTEVNGCQLQLLSRLYWMTRDERYLEMAERIAEAYLFEVIPQNGGLPTDYWDFAAQEPLPEDARFRPEAEVVEDVYPFRISDHGGEIVPGLAELYFLERTLDRPQADRYREPLQALLDRLLEVARNDEGLWYHSIVPATSEPFDANLSDTWGYTLAAYQTFDLAEGTDRYADVIEEMMRTIAAKHSVPWEGHNADGYADTVESMLYLLPWFDVPEAHRWVDDEVEVMFLKQRFDGFVEGWFLDGNFVRTALLYAQYKTQGLGLAPWSEGVRLGAALDRGSGALYVYLAAEEEWDGRLRFDTPRHRAIWGLPIEYPRVNGAPEWYVVEADSVYVVSNLDTGSVSTYSGQELADGLAVSLREHPRNVLRLSVTRQESANGSAATAPGTVAEGRP